VVSALLQALSLSCGPAQPPPDLGGSGDALPDTPAGADATEDLLAAEDAPGDAGGATAAADAKCPETDASACSGPADGDASGVADTTTDGEAWAQELPAADAIDVGLSADGGAAAGPELLIGLVWSAPCDGPCPTAPAPVLDLHLARWPEAAEGQEDADCDGAGDPWFQWPHDAWRGNPAPAWFGPSKAMNPGPSCPTGYMCVVGIGMGQLPVASGKQYTFAIGVHVWHGPATPIKAVVSIYLKGTLIAMATAEGLVPGDMWTVGRFVHPSNLSGAPGVYPTPMCFAAGDACGRGRWWRPTAGDACVHHCQAVPPEYALIGPVPPAACPP
jgi:hypothetical protein